MSRWSDTGKFVLKWTVLGLATAFVVVLARPQWLLHPAADKQPTVLAMGFANAVERTAPAVVNIYTARLVTEEVASGAPNGAGSSSPTRRQGVETGLGSGVIVDNEGHIVTNNHLIACAQQINVQLADGRTQAVAVVGTDPATDIAVLKISMDNPPVAPLGSSSALRPGDIALAIGTPYGLSQTVTQGIVSATGRGQLGVTAIEAFIQTDAAINQGNSGGALINADGELIGINTAALSQANGVSGISFAIPVDLVRGVMQEILQYGRVKRGWFGVETRGLSTQQAAALGLAAPDGLAVVQVYENSPAARAGLQPGDVITRINGAQRSLSEALRVVASTAPGERISLSVLRQGKTYDLTVTVTERSPDAGVRNPCNNTDK
ncbi:MAG: S1C family serine protease [Steroidobacteraceae bacterium]